MVKDKALTFFDFLTSESEMYVKNKILFEDFCGDVCLFVQKTFCQANMFLSLLRDNFP